jgi:hypothetical protein
MFSLPCLASGKDFTTEICHCGKPIVATKFNKVPNHYVYEEKEKDTLAKRPRIPNTYKFNAFQRRIK